MPKSHLKPDPNNANIGTERGNAMLGKSLQNYGAGRSVLTDRNGVILAGNKTFSKAIELGIPIQVIESDGKTLYAIQRTDLDVSDANAKELAIADNRVSEVSLTWNPDVLQSFIDDDIDLSQFWLEDELIAILDAIPESQFPEYNESVEDEVQYCECPECGHRFPK